MEFTLEVVPVPVTDLDRAKDFYEKGCGFTVDVDAHVSPDVRIIQITPPGSRCSIALTSGMPGGNGIEQMPPGSLQGVQLCVTDIATARAGLVERGVEVTPIRHVGADGWADGPGEEAWNSFCSFADPDGNGWVIQEAPTPLSAR